ncbi:Cof-type HAD-IIB family hydrolase [Aerococcus sp. UMB10185]|uniref:Cof-type HAD-IIB family hydrolase n=1 Tax=unclassified Aerococcus TaxID=2618060 RepID=UPI0008A2BBAF|nr:MULTISPECIES: Cof-type HAD-IIB family hydrolase [unclassified Aerococcus]KAB0647687.1 Cof-type HAD-IIB family hydrolase [Aerococcus sanguinicola]MDK6233073.1 Cof-type HAD-IIB family hydrolase [Aerococcus sp. UMB10185]MDK6855368.1 Cof-type HAD-IIB family hydrolase [Aerococcus sp. UMB7533]OFN05300.1 hypothetical protein HMPREF2626_03610 [Aerococcus sp. HMSC062A02]OHO43699.1 hypothetical protein HMPREF2705_07805 [Aerococcus sp. HMSC035B07]
MKALVAIDLDGTLLNPDKEVSAANRQAIQAALAAGVEIVICTGRPLAAIEAILQKVGLDSADHYSVTYNGGLVVANRGQEVLFEETLTMEDLASIYPVLHDLGLPLEAVSRNRVYQLPYPTDYPGHYGDARDFLPTEKVSLADLDGDLTFPKLVVATEPDHLDAQIPKLPQDFYQDYSLIHSVPEELEFMAQGIDKGKALGILADRLGYSKDQVYAIGDERNDAAMFAYAGTGIAMANSHPDILAQADLITRSNSQDGVAYALREFILKKPGDLIQ